MKSIHTQLLGAAVAALLSACSGGDEESATEPTAIDTPAAGAAYVATVTDFFDLADVASAKRWSSQPPRRAAPAKAAEQFDCEGGGSHSFDRETGRAEYINCVYEFSFGDYTETETIHGVELEECAPSVGGGSRYTQDCMGEYLDTYGEAGTPITYDIRDSDGADVYYSDLYTDRYSSAAIGDGEGWAYDSRLNGRSFYRDRTRMSRAATFTFTDFQVIERYYDDGREEYAINGSLGSDQGAIVAGCSVGTANFTTITPFSISSNGALVGGEMTVTNEAGQKADLVINNGQFVITVNGVSESYSASELDDICP